MRQLLRRWRLRLHGTALGETDAVERDDEMAFHIEMATRRNIARGMDATEARRQALVLFGGEDRMREEVRDVQRARPLEDLLQDAAHAVHMLMRAPAFAFAAIATLAIGIGANSAIFSVLDAVLLRPLPYAAPQQLVAFKPETFVAYHQYTEHNASLASAGAFLFSSTNVSDSDEPVRVWQISVTSSMLPTLGVNPALGRNFTAADDQPGAPPRAILRNEFWRTHFAADRGIIGRSIHLNGRAYEVIGVLPASLEFPPPARHEDGSMPTIADVWTGVGQMDDLNETGGFYSVARMAPGATIDRVRAEMNAITKNSSALGDKGIDGSNAIKGIEVQSVTESVVAPLRPAILVFMVGVFLILFIACANIGSLLLARLTGRTREFAVRTSLGATGSRIARQILTEGLVLSVAGAVGGLAVGYLMLRALLHAAPSQLSRVQGAALDGRALIFTGAITIACTFLIGLLPAWRATKRTQRDVLTSSRGSTQDRGTAQMHGVLVACEVAFAVILLIGGGLLMRSYDALAHVTPGFDPSHLVTADVLVVGERYPDRASVLQFFNQIEARISQIPGVQSVSAIDRLPYAPSWSGIQFDIAGRVPQQNESRPRGFNTASRPGYFATMGIPLVRGHDFTARDTKEAPQVVIIGQVVADRYWPNANPIGAHINVFGTDREIVGVAGDIRHFGPLTPVDPMVYLPQAQDAATRRMMTIVLRTNGNPSSVLAAVRAAIHDADAQLPVSNLRTFDALRAQRTASQRFDAMLMTTFALIAVLLACVGIYGVMSFVVTQRTREIGVRMALGATRNDVLQTFLAIAMRAVAFGTAIGLLVAIPLTKLGRSLLFGVTPLDVTTYVLVIGVVGAVTVASAFAPALRASAIQPGVALGD